ncbi:hypothetical protein P8605_08860 [Streptomyces sp. T-3]|nr:hypothetical protein [Streptomyces sp. T-3]
MPAASPASLRLTCAVIVLAAGTFGCSAAASPASPPTSGEAVRARPGGPPASAQAREIALPFDTYKISVAEDLLIDSATDILIGRCMKAQGMRWTQLPPAGARDVSPPNRRRYGLIEEKVAERFGYHAPPESARAERRAAAEENREAGLSDAEFVAANGRSGDGGCWKEAYRQVVEDSSGSGAGYDYEFLNTAAADAFEKSRRESGVQQAFHSWSACMKKSGFNYTDPLNAAADKRWQSKKPSGAEIEAARADVRCKRQTGLVKVWSAADTKIQKAAVEAHPTEFRALKDTKQAQLAAARRILEGKFRPPG